MAMYPEKKKKQNNDLNRCKQKMLWICLTQKINSKSWQKMI